MFKFFDKLEDKIRHSLSKHPIIYALIGGFATVLFWRGVWEFTDRNLPFLTPGISIIVSVLVMLGTGTFVSFFLGEQIIASGLREEKRIEEKTEEEVKKESEQIQDIFRFIVEIRHDVANIRRRLNEMEKEKDKDKEKDKKDSTKKDSVKK